MLVASFLTNLLFGFVKNGRIHFVQSIPSVESIYGLFILSLVLNTPFPDSVSENRLLELFLSEMYGVYDQALAIAIGVTTGLSKRGL